MGVPKPYKRTCRQFTDGSYAEAGKWMYIRHPDRAIAPTQYIRAFKIIQKDLLELFDYIEPSDINLQTYSYRTHALLMRTCIEVEANFKAILDENGYTSARDLNMGDYEKVNRTHRLSSYKMKLSDWHGSRNVRQPYSAWTSPGGRLPWYQAYNASKHSRHVNFKKASFDALLDAACGLVALISAQFWTTEFFPTGGLLVTFGDISDNFEEAIGGYFRVRFPTDWPLADRYDFDWQTLKSQPDPVDTLTF